MFHLRALRGGLCSRARLNAFLDVGTERFDGVERFLGHLFSRE